jgi:hypothetical protein
MKRWMVTVHHGWRVFVAGQSDDYEGAKRIFAGYQSMYVQPVKRRGALPAVKFWELRHSVEKVKGGVVVEKSTLDILNEHRRRQEARKVLKAMA